MISLAEDGETLEHLLRIIYQDRDVWPPDTLPFAQLVLLADAAEKYQVYAALITCRLAMKYVLWLAGWARSTDK